MIFFFNMVLVGVVFKCLCGEVVGVSDGLVLVGLCFGVIFGYVLIVVIVGLLLCMV